MPARERLTSALAMAVTSSAEQMSGVARREVTVSQAPERDAAMERMRPTEPDAGLTRGSPATPLLQ